MRVSVFGLGYVGTVSAACLSQQGHHVVGVDVSQVKVDLINEGKSPIVEAEVGEMLQTAVQKGLLSATTNLTEAIHDADVSLICVGTPSRENGSLDLQYIRNVAQELGRALKDIDKYHVVAVRSTMLPGSLENEVLPLIESESNKTVGEQIGLCLNPEFLREGTAVSDYHHPPFTLIGSFDERGGSVLAELYKDIDATIIRTEIRTAEMVKYTCNTFHALKVAFANEIGLFCKQLEIDSHEVMDIFTQDRQLNISSKYLKPGFAFGGSCLPKDLRALLHRAKTLDTELPVLSSLLPSNDRHIDHSFKMIQRTEKKRIGLLGLSFKAGTDDLRESPIVRLAEQLIGKGFDVRIFDKQVSLAAIVGANKHYIQKVIPHISTLIVNDEQQLLDHSEVLVVGNNGPEFRDILTRVNDQHHVIDLVRIQNGSSGSENYEGICW